jgi:hypothetical protein
MFLLFSLSLSTSCSYHTFLFLFFFSFFFKVFFDQISNFGISAMHLSIYFRVVPYISSLVAVVVCWLCFCFE